MKAPHYTPIEDIARYMLKAYPRRLVRFELMARFGADLDAPEFELWVVHIGSDPLIVASRHWTVDLDLTQSVDSITRDIEQARARFEIAKGATCTVNEKRTAKGKRDAGAPASSSRSAATAKVAKRQPGPPKKKRPSSKRAS